ncbi:MAG: phosphoenolpyruvate--protein phosphotransferase [Elusimicrobiaceae bacterium]|nr:phosphoenolpyruvate--protein phosphotransferase [Elusimicrobiaceae bacterium]
MKKWQATGVFPKIVIGPIYCVPDEQFHVPTHKITDTEAEITHFEKARQQAKIQLKELYQQALVQTGEESAAIFDIHQMMLEDADYIESVHTLIAQEKENAAQAVEKTGQRFARIFADMDDEYMKARAADVQDISQRLLRILCHVSQHITLQEPSILLAKDLVPSQLLSVPPNLLLGFATAQGTSNSHASILARTQGLAAVVGVGEEMLRHATNGQTAILDGEHGILILSPDEETLHHARQLLDQQQKTAQALEKLKGTPDQTQDGTLVRLYANVSSLGELQTALQADARGVGLFRTELFYLQSSTYPTEEELFDVYRQAVQLINGKQIIFRTLDIGADKTAPYFQLPNEENPALGLRAIRLCLTRTDLLKTQLRALLRASAFGNMAIMFPMITSLSEVKQTLAILEEVKTQLQQESIPFCKTVPVGIMIETPAAALISEQLAPLVDFFSIGTNDLIQYTCALDRQNPNLLAFTDTHHPAVLKLIEYTARNAHAAGKWVGICGELAADTSLTETFLKMGIEELSVAAAHLLRVRQVIQNTRLSH